MTVDLPVAFALEGLGRTARFWDRYRRRRGEVIAAFRKIEVQRHTGLGVTKELAGLKKAITSWEQLSLLSFDAREPAPITSVRQSASECSAAVAAAYPAYPVRDSQEISEKERKRNEAARTLDYYLRRLASALQALDGFLQSAAARAAEAGALLITGDAGQGKTHLLCDAGQRAIQAQRPAAVLLGGRFSGRKVWDDVGALLGLGDVGSTELLGAFRAAAEAAGAPFLLLIDALNEAADAAGWQEELPALLAEVRGDPWLAVGVSVRSSYEAFVLPPPERVASGRLPRMMHPGFSGRDLEATERFFDAFQLQQPRIPLLRPEFTNPLFLKLYCEGLKGLGLTSPELGHVALSEVFLRYVDARAAVIVRALKLDPTDRPVQAAVDAFSAALVDAGREALPYAAGKALITEFAPDATAWPETLFGTLLSEGVLTKDLSWDRAAKTQIEVVRFSYQRFADHRVAEALLRPYADEAALRAAFEAKATPEGTLPDRTGRMA